MTDSLQAVRPNQLSTTAGIKFREYVEQFLAAQDIRELSKEVYRQGLEHFIKWAEQTVEGTLQRADIVAYKEHLKSCPISVNTANSRLTALRCFFAYLESERITPDITKKVRGFKQPRAHLRDPLSLQQVEEVLSSIDRSSEEGCRDYTLMSLLARCGLRTIEVSRADIGDIRQQSGEALLWVQRKGHDSKDEYVLLVPEMLERLRFYLRTYRKGARPEEPLFVSCSDRNRGARISTASIRVMVKKHLRRVGIDDPRLSAHSFRHFFATTSLRAGAQLLQVKEALGHCSVETTQRYVRNLTRIEEGAERFIQLSA